MPTNKETTDAIFSYMKAYVDRPRRTIEMDRTNETISLSIDGERFILVFENEWEAAYFEQMEFYADESMNDIIEIATLNGADKQSN